MPVTPITPTFGSTPTTTATTPTTSTTSATSTTSTTATATATGGSNGLDRDTFLSLLVAQLKYQDPMKPTDSAQFLAQTAQFTTVERLQELADVTNKSLSATLAFGSTAMVGRTVTYGTAEGGTATGVVTSVTFGSDGPLLDIDGTQVRLADVRSVVQDGASAPTTETDTSTQTSTDSTSSGAAGSAA